MKLFLLVYLILQISRVMSIMALNSTHAILRCPPAENFIRTHMAPDFETPRLVRRLDWFQDDSLVATYQQDVMSDSSRQWWVADARFQLIPPFYSLRVSPLTPEDSGTYRCRIETDPLFSTSSSTASQELAVMVRPVAPSSPEIKSVSNRSITLVWTHNAARAHRPILRFLISVRTINNNSKFMLPAPSNATTVIVDNLFPYTLYAFAVQAENSAGFSEFGPETTFRTLGEAPEVGPQIEKIRNVSSNCVEVSIRPPEEMTGELEKYIVQTQAVNETTPRKLIFDKPTSTPLAICGLHAETRYVISVEADNGFGTSPPITSMFQTEPDIPNWSPITITTVGVVGKPEITVLWDAPPPNVTRLINKYHLYYKSESDSQWKMENLNMNRNSSPSKKFKYRLVGLDPNTLYRVRVSASTEKGEGRPSADSLLRTDIDEPGMIIMKDVLYDCGHGVKMAWNYEAKGTIPIYTIKISNLTTTLQYNTTQKYIEIPNLSLHDQYSVEVSVIDRSKLDNSTILIGKWSESHRIILKEKCTFQSSLCSIGEKCSKLTQEAEAPKLVSIIIVIFSVILFMFICILIAHFARGSMNFKHLLKKKKEKCVYLEEISPLVYDSNGHEDIPVELFYGYVEDLKRDCDAKFRAQFEQIERIEHDSTDSSSSSNLENSTKNRYNNIGANEATRIRLNSPSGSDYINANYIDSCEERNAYIATQAPLPSTFSDFWSMVWQERSNVIVCITNMIEEGKRKCDQYWPTSIDSPQTYGCHQVTLLSESTNSHFTHRVLDLKLVGSLPIVERKVHQLHFMSWPDHGVPSSVMPLLNFIHYTSDIPSTGPQIVHCSAGVGRSGSYILVDSMRRHLINFRRLNVIGHLYHMRRQRDHLVQTLEQFIFCHEAIRQLIRHGITRVHSDLFMRYLHYLSEENVKNGKTRMQLQYEDICECRHSPPCQIDENFVSLPGFHRNDEFIVGKWPSENEEIWRLCWKKNIETVVLIGDYSKYWQKLEKVDSMTLKHNHDFVEIQNSTDSKMSIKIINMSQERLESDIWMEIENIQKLRTSSHTSPLLLISPNDLNYPVMICGLTTLACQLETTGCVDIVQVLSAYSMIQCGIFSNKIQIDLIYRMVSVLVGGTRV